MRTFYKMFRGIALAVIFVALAMIFKPTSRMISPSSDVREYPNVVCQIPSEMLKGSEAFSPDRSLKAYVTYLADGYLCVSASDGQSDPILLADVKIPKRITQIAWSHDGTRIAQVEDANDNGIVMTTSKVYITDLEGHSVQVNPDSVTLGLTPKWMVGDQILTFTEATSAPQMIYFVDTKTLKVIGTTPSP